MNTVSKINYSEREGLEHQRVELLEQLKKLQFKLFDKSSPEVVEHLNQLHLEKAKQQSLLKKAQSRLQQLEPELENFKQGTELILLEAISQQDWYRFKNKREIVFNSKTGLVFPNFEYIPHIEYADWKAEQKNYAPNDIGKGKWLILSEIFLL